MGKLIDLTGQRFGRLLVCRKSDKENHQHCAFWICKCDCGRGCTVLGSALRDGRTKSCGCYRSERASAIITKYGNRKGRPKRKDKVNG
nr:MAG TPA: hypothetical protein [Caudoviricetes sp.]